ncbi:MFS transporter [soil metagenome]
MHRTPSTRTLSRRASFAVSAAIVGLALWTSGAPAITYPLYAEEWHLTTTTTTVIFALYPIALVVSLAIVGNLSDYIGRRSAMLLGLTASFIGVLMFAVAPSVGWLFVGRAFMGVGVALSLSPGTAAVVEFSAPGQQKRASAIATTATAVGLALAVLVGGALIQYAPFPTRLNFWVLLLVLAVTAVFAWFLPRHTAVEALGRWRPRGMFVPRGIRPLFVLAALAMVGCFTLGVIQLSLGADIAKGLIGSTNAFVTGSVIAVNAVAIGVSALATRNVRPAPLIAVGGIAAVLGASSLLLSSFEHSLPIFLVSAIVSGAGYSLLFSGGLGVINAHAPVTHRAGSLSTLYLVAYLSQAIVAPYLGFLATASGLERAIEVGALIIVAFSVAALVLAVTVGRRPRLEGLATAH